MQNIDKRFGAVALEQGFIMKQQLLDAMMVQIEEDLDGKEHRLIGQILLARGIITPNHIQTVLTVMGIPNLASRSSGTDREHCDPDAV